MLEQLAGSEHLDGGRYDSAGRTQEDRLDRARSADCLPQAEDGADRVSPMTGRSYRVHRPTGLSVPGSAGWNASSRAGTPSGIVLHAELTRRGAMPAPEAVGCHWRAARIHGGHDDTEV
jgi:hypothetical protein